MRGFLATAVLLLLLAGCGTRSPHASALQRYDALAPLLRRQQQLTVTVSGDWGRAGSFVSDGRTIDARRVSLRLIAASEKLSRLTSRLVLRVGALERGNTSGTPRQYFRDVIAGLRCESWEAREVGWTARLIQRDPLLEQGADAKRLSRLSNLARWSSRRAARFAENAQQVAEHHPRLFRYVPAYTGR